MGFCPELPTTVGGNSTNHKKQDAMSKQSDLKLTDHHIVPSSRGGKGGANNIKRAPHSYHDAYHHLFANLTPAEIYDYLDQVWFNPNRSFIKPEQWLEQSD